MCGGAPREHPNYYAYLAVYPFTDMLQLQLHHHIYLVDAVFIHHIRLRKSDLFIDVLRVAISTGIGGNDDLGVVLLFEQCQQFLQRPLAIMPVLIGAVDGEIPEEEAVSLKGAEHGKADACVPVPDVVGENVRVSECLFDAFRRGKLLSVCFGQGKLEFGCGDKYHVQIPLYQNTAISSL